MPYICKYLASKPHFIYSHFPLGIIDGNLAGTGTGNNWSKGYKDPHVPSHPQKDRTKPNKEYTSGPSTKGQWNNVNTNVIR